MKRYLTDFERSKTKNVDCRNIELWTDSSDHMQFKCKKCGTMMDLITSPYINRYRGEGGAIYLHIFCQHCDEIYDKKIYFGSPANDMRSSVEYELRKKQGLDSDPD